MGVATRYPVNWAANLSASCHIDHIALHSKNRKVLKRIILIETLLFVRRVDLPLKQTKRRLQQSKKRIRKKSNISSIHSLYNPKFQSFNSPTKQLYYYSTKNKTSKEKETNRESINPKKKEEKKKHFKNTFKNTKKKQSLLWRGEQLVRIRLEQQRRNRQCMRGYIDHLLEIHRRHRHLYKINGTIKNIRCCSCWFFSSCFIFSTWSIPNTWS